MELTPGERTRARAGARASPTHAAVAAPRTRARHAPSVPAVDAAQPPVVAPPRLGQPPP